MKISTLEVCFLSLIMVACSSNPPSDECSSDECFKQRAYDGVIAVHDIVMPKLSYISDLKGRIEERMNNEQDTLRIEEWERQMESLDAADEAMWVWMRNFNSDLEEVPVDEALEYLASEKKSVDAMALKVTDAIEAAELSLK